MLQYVKISYYNTQRHSQFSTNSILAPFQTYILDIRNIDVFSNHYCKGILYFTLLKRIILYNATLNISYLFCCCCNSTYQYCIIKLFWIHHSIIFNTQIMREVKYLRLMCLVGNDVWMGNFIIKSQNATKKFNALKKYETLYA